MTMKCVACGGPAQDDDRLPDMLAKIRLLRSDFVLYGEPRPIKLALRRAENELVSELLYMEETKWKTS